jgi:predicted DNA-binding antitoxin AbrB/MazE fold protein
MNIDQRVKADKKTLELFVNLTKEQKIDRIELFIKEEWGFKAYDERTAIGVKIVSATTSTGVLKPDQAVNQNLRSGEIDDNEIIIIVPARVSEKNLKKGDQIIALDGITLLQYTEVKLKEVGLVGMCIALINDLAIDLYK